MIPTPTDSGLPLRYADFSSLAAALDYAARGETGLNFYNGRGELASALPYRRLRERALASARRLRALGLQPGERVAMVADTVPEFMDCFFACQYGGWVPVPLPVQVGLGSSDAYVGRLQTLLADCQPAAALAPEAFLPYLEQAAGAIPHVLAFEALAALPLAPAQPAPPDPQAIAYLQYTSGSTRQPRGVVIDQTQVLTNIASILRPGVQMSPDDRLVSWLPLFHDMGLVGFVLAAVASQRSVDYLATRDFAMRPRLWLQLISRNRGTIAFSPSFGYELCARRIRRGADAFDLRSWRIAGAGAETIRPQALAGFAEALAPAGFDPKAFVACYGMAECALAVSFAPLGQGLSVDAVDAEVSADTGRAQPADANTVRITRFVDCGRVLPDFELEIRDGRGRLLPDRQVGSIFVRGPSVMSGYFRNDAETRRTLSADGWMDTGDLGYRIADHVVIAGREKDLIIVNGRNIWPRDLEWLAEQQPELRPGDALAFAAPFEHGEDGAVMVVQCRQRDPQARAELVARLEGLVLREFGVACLAEAVAPHTLPRTSSGKLSRAGARKDYLARLRARLAQRSETRRLGDAENAADRSTG